MDPITTGLLAIGLLLLKGFFSGATMVILYSDKTKLRHQARLGDLGAKKLLKAFEEPDLLLSTAWTGNTLSTLALTTLAALAIFSLVEHHGSLYAFLIFVPLWLILGELSPKSLCQQKANELAPWMIYPLSWFSILLTPVTSLFSWLITIIAKLSGHSTENSLSITKYSHAALTQSQKPSLTAFSQGQIRKVTRFAETTVSEVMLPLAEVKGIPRNKTIDHVIEVVKRYGFNRLPMYEGTANNIVGIFMLTAWDLMDETLKTKPITDFIHDPYYASPHQTIDEILPILAKRTDHIAIVVDEYGAAIGMITMEDILEEVIGEVDMGFAFEEYTPKNKRVAEAVSDDTYLLDSRFPIAEVNELLGIQLSTYESHTIGGFILGRLRHIPQKGEFVVESGFRFTVEIATSKAIVKLKVAPEKNYLQPS